MILLTSTSDLIQVITGGTQAIKCHASYVDLNGTTVTPGRLNTAISSATTTTIVASPAASTQRTVKTLSVHNSDGSNADTVTVQHTDGTTVIILFSLSLLAGNSLKYNEGSGWQLFNALGQTVATAPASGQFLKSTVLTSASGTFTTGTNTNSIFIRGVAGGGAGGGCTSVASAAGAAGGGGSGSYIEKTVAVSPNTGYSYTCGAGGTGVSGAGGNNGNNSTFVVGATTYTANAGGGAAVATANAALTANLGGNGGAVSTNGDLNATGTAGNKGVILIVATPAGASGDGGDSAFGGGAKGVNAAGNGNTAGNFGGGGSGSMTGASTARTGGGGGPGCWVVEEYS